MNLNMERDQRAPPLFTNLKDPFAEKVDIFWALLQRDSLEVSFTIPVSCQLSHLIVHSQKHAVGLSSLPSSWKHSISISWLSFCGNLLQNTFHGICGKVLQWERHEPNSFFFSGITLAFLASECVVTANTCMRRSNSCGEVSGECLALYTPQRRRTLHVSKGCAI